MYYTIHSVTVNAESSLRDDIITFTFTRAGDIIDASFEMNDIVTEEDGAD
ncbi:MAG: hypothetical protein ACYTAO_03965 [Planctomycetota bacterium]|jgi:hypothetical protein